MNTHRFDDESENKTPSPRGGMLSIVALIIAAAIGFIFYNKNVTQSSSASGVSAAALPLIAMTQIIEHNTLDTVRQGFLDGLAKAGYIDGKTVRIIYENAHGNMATASQITAKFAAQSPRLLVAFSTQSAQLLLPLSKDKNIPLLFTAVTDPKAAQLTDHPTVTGVSDFMPAQPQLEMMRSMLPQLKKLGVIYNTAEVNSVSYLEYVAKDAKAMGIELVYAAINKTSEAMSVTQSLVGKVDAIYFPNDNTAMAAAEAIAQTGHQNHIPVFANDSASVDRGCLAALAYDRIAMGKKTADMAVKILTGTKPSDLPITNEIPFVVAENKKAKEILGVDGS